MCYSVMNLFDVCCDGEFFQKHTALFFGAKNALKKKTVEDRPALRRARSVA